MTIHSEHPFLPPEGDRSAVRRVRGRMALPVSVWASVQDGRRVGWTVSSVLVADGEPPELLGLLDEDSELADVLPQSLTLAVSLLGAPHQFLADAFAGLVPAPGGAFRLGSWRDTEWGPVLVGAPAWLGVRLGDGVSERAGWTLLVRGTIEHAEVADEAESVLGYLRGRYRQLDL